MTRMIARFRDGSSFDLTLVALALAYLFVFAALPMLYTVVMSVQKIDMFTLGTLARPFVGLRNYAHVLAMPVAWRVATNTAIFVVLSVVLQLVIGLVLAIYFRQDFPGASTLRGLFLAGWVMPALVVGAIWRWLLAGDFGVVNFLLGSLGLIKGHIFWISDPHVALYSLIIANVWLGIPFNMLLLSVGLAAIPADVYEAASLDGASAIQRFLFVTLPMMRATLGAVLSLSIIFTMQQYDLVAALTQGGPSNASNVAQYWSWQLSFETYDIAGGSVVAVVMILVVILVAILYVRSTRLEQQA
ncbi:sugar ABC transporter permease [Acidisoma cellulosilytica]|uniref:Sugar ABC transporter permease n=1 Tax=Acidisoma cellulosilyticum TaxID=2802395 RepID=A0A963Z479_9PROT|nr:sugar ABC transporter permease [Acidisoma cellulosilyticum]MCB8881453.1 sugar ABC transporter permease [Acidisoma cellulosilyticum]